MRVSGWIFGLVLLALSSGLAQAAIMWELNLRNNNSAGPVAPFATVTMDQPGGAGGDITVTLDLVGSFNGATIEEFGFNTTEAGGFGGAITAPGWSVDTSGRNFSVYGDFEIALFNSSVVDKLMFTIGSLGAGQTIATFSTEPGSGGELFAVKLAAGTPGGAFLGGGTVVPVPAALPLLLSALAAFGFVTRRGRKAAAAA